MTLEEKKAFLLELSTGQSISAAAAKTGRSRASFYNYRHTEPDFAAAWDEALEMGVDSLEDEAVKRAKDGSDVLLIFLLKGNRPEKFKDRHEHTGANNGPISVAHELSDDALARIAAGSSRRAIEEKTGQG